MSLANALQRRARDVSQLDMPAADASDPAASSGSGAFKFNHSLSTSGAFSATGSRVDIDVKSDPDYFKKLYYKYNETLKQNGEEPAKLTLEQFVSRMAKEKENLIRQYKCRDVRFEIRMKNGKTSLKAIPLK